MTMDKPIAEIWLFHPDANAHLYKSVADALGDVCEGENWEFRTRRIYGARAPQGRPLAKILSEDATNLYKRLHRARVGVWQIGDARAPTTPQPRHAPKTTFRLPISSATRHFTPAFPATDSRNRGARLYQSSKSG